MKRLLDFIYDVFSANANIKTPVETMSDIEDVINLFIELNYDKIEKKKYFFIDGCDNDGKLKVHIDDSFEEELKKHYPEKLI